MGIHELLDRFDELGIVLTARDGRLVISGASRMTGELRQALREHKQAIVEALTPVVILDASTVSTSTEVSRPRDSEGFVDNDPWEGAIEPPEPCPLDQGLFGANRKHKPRAGDDMTRTPSTLPDLLADCDAHGIRLALVDGGGLEIDAPQDSLTPDLLDRLRAHKGKLVAFIERFEERAAIMEFDAGLSRHEAERLAWKHTLRGAKHPIE